MSTSKLICVGLQLMFTVLGISDWRIFCSSFKSLEGMISFCSPWNSSRVSDFTASLWVSVAAIRMESSFSSRRQPVKIGRLSSWEQEKAVFWMRSRRMTSEIWKLLLPSTLAIVG